MILPTDLRRDSTAKGLIVSVDAVSDSRNTKSSNAEETSHGTVEMKYKKQLTTSSESSIASCADDSSGANVSAPTESGSTLSYSCSQTNSSALQQCSGLTDDNDSLSISSIDSLHDALEVEFHTDLDHEIHYSSPKEPPPSPPSKREFMALRFTYLLVTLVIMLADGLQGKYQLEVETTLSL
jgi:hypothetical protein